MNPTAHTYEDKLLEFAYGELPEPEARSVEAHLKGCAKCTGALESIRGVRRTMAVIEPEPAPDAGLDSLLAYAQQAARRHGAGPAPVRSPWRRWVFSIAGAASLVVVAVVGTMTAREINLEQRFSEAAKEQAAPAATPPRANVQAEPAAPEALAADELGAKDVAAGMLAEETLRQRRELDQQNYQAGGELPRGRAADEADYAQSRTMAEAKKKAPSKSVSKKSALEKSGFGDDRLADSDGSGGPAPAQAQTADRRSLSLKGSGGVLAKEESVEAEAPREDTGVAAAEPMATGGGVGAARPAQPQAVAPPPARTGERVAAAPSAASEVYGYESRAAEGSSVVTESAPSKAAVSRKTDTGSLTTEAEQLRQEAAVSQGAHLITVLSRLCEVEVQLGRYQPASCNRLVKEFPSTGAARMARSRLESQREKMSAPADAQSN